MNNTQSKKTAFVSKVSLMRAFGKFLYYLLSYCRLSVDDGSLDEPDKPKKLLDIGLKVW